MLKAPKSINFDFRHFDREVYVLLYILDLFRVTIDVYDGKVVNLRIQHTWRTCFFLSVKGGITFDKLRGVLRTIIERYNWYLSTELNKKKFTVGQILPEFDMIYSRDYTIEFYQGNWYEGIVKTLSIFEDTDDI